LLTVEEGIYAAERTSEVVGTYPQLSSSDVICIERVTGTVMLFVPLSSEYSTTEDLLSPTELSLS